MIREGLGLRHQALFYDRDEDFHAAAVSFVREAVEREETVLVNVGGNPAANLLKAMFGGSDQVEFFSTPLLDRPASVLHHYKTRVDLLLRDRASSVRALGCVPVADSRMPWKEWLRYEAAVSHVFDGYPMQSLCPYDVRTTKPDVVTAMRAAHPYVVEGRETVENREHVDVGTLLEQAEYGPELDPLEERVPAVELEDVTDLRALRLDLYPVGLFTGLPKRTVDDFVKAVVEVTANGRAHGAGPVRVRLWAAHDKLVCTVTDQGPGIVDPLLGYGRSMLEPGSETADAGLGLWAARQLCDTLDYARTDEGFTVRLVTAHP